MPKNNVDNGHSRHKCSICGRVRFEHFMEVICQLYNGQKYPFKTRYGNQCWVCLDNLDCQDKKNDFYVY